MSPWSLSLMTCSCHLCMCTGLPACGCDVLLRAARARDARLCQADPARAVLEYRSAREGQALGAPGLRVQPLRGRMASRVCRRRHPLGRRGDRVLLHPRLRLHSGSERCFFFVLCLRSWLPRLMAELRHPHERYICFGSILIFVATNLVVVLLVVVRVLTLAIPIVYSPREDTYM